MNNQINYQNCPICKSSLIKPFIVCKDYTVSQEDFEIFTCTNCSASFTQNIPTQITIGKYYQSANYISHSDTKEGFISKIYHRVRSITLQKKCNLIKKYSEENKRQLLDIGAGTGAFAKKMLDEKWKVTALEPDDIARQNAKNKYNLQLETPEKLFTLQKNSYNVITLWHVLEHIHTLEEYLKQFHQILENKGKLFIAVPNYTSYDAKYYKEFWAGFDVPRHLYHFSPKSINILANSFGFEVIAKKAMWFDSTYVSMLSEQYKTGKNNFVKALYVGLFSNLKAIFNVNTCSSIIYILEKK